VGRLSRSTCAISRRGSFDGYMQLKPCWGFGCTVHSLDTPCTSS
jgi:hypothetical protein